MLSHVVLVHVRGNVELNCKVTSSDGVHILLFLIETLVCLQTPNEKHEAEGYEHHDCRWESYFVILFGLFLFTLGACVLNEELSVDVHAIFITCTQGAVVIFNHGCWQSHSKKTRVIQVKAARALPDTCRIKVLKNTFLIKFIAAQVIIEVIFLNSHACVLVLWFTGSVYTKSIFWLFILLVNFGNVSIWTRHNYGFHRERDCLALNGRITQVSNRVVSVSCMDTRGDGGSRFEGKDHWVHQDTHENEENAQSKECSSISNQTESIWKVWIFSS